MTNISKLCELIKGYCSDNIDSEQFQSELTELCKRYGNPLYIENKSKRLQLLTKPSTAEKLRAKAQREGRSVNDIVNTILEEALNRGKLSR